MARFDSEYFAKMEQKEQAERKTKRQLQREEEDDALLMMELDRIRQEEEVRETAKRSRLAAEAERKRKAKLTAAIKRSAEDFSYRDESGMAAALCNEKHGFSRILAEGHDPHACVHIVVERFQSPKIRLKRTSYRFFDSMAEVRKWAEENGWTLTEYGSEIS